MSSVVCSTFLLAAVTASGASAAQRPSKSHQGAKQPRFVHQTGISKDRPTQAKGRVPQGGVLYDQTAGQSGNGNTSQDFEAQFDAYDNAGADDFVVPGGETWTITGGTAVGQYSAAGPSPQLIVNFYNDAGGVPGTVACPYLLNAGVDYTDAAGIFTFTLPTSCVLTSGTYWFSAVSRMDFLVGGQWFWNTVTPQAGAVAKWQNPGGGFGTPCATWGDLPTCLPPTTDLGWAFQLTGTNGGGGGPLQCQVGSNYVTGTSAGTIVPGVTDTGSACDDCIVAVALPFPVAFYDQTFNTANLSSNGSVQFVSADTSFTNVCPMPVPFFDNAITVFDDMRTDANPGCAGFPGGVCGIFTSTTGVSPNQVFHIEWRAVYFAANATPVNFEIRLHEDNANFEIVTGTMNTQSSATVGVQRDTGSMFTEFGCNVATADNTQIGFTCTLVPVELMGFSVQ